MEHIPRFRAILWLWCFFLLPASSAIAQEHTRRWELFAEVGASWYTSASNRGSIPLPPAPGLPSSLPFTSTTSFQTTGRLFTGFRYYLSPRNAVEASYSYSPNDFQRELRVTEGSLFASPIFVPLDTNVHNVAFNYVRYLTHRRLRPFVTGGLGFTVFDSSFRSSTKFAGNFGGGVDIRVGSRILLRAEFRDFLNERLRFGNPFAPGGVTHNLVPSVGIVLKF